MPSSDGIHYEPEKERQRQVRIYEPDEAIERKFSRKYTLNPKMKSAYKKRGTSRPVSSEELAKTLAHQKELDRQKKQQQDEEEARRRMEEQEKKGRLQKLKHLLPCCRNEEGE